MAQKGREQHEATKKVKEEFNPYAIKINQVSLIMYYTYFKITFKFFICILPDTKFAYYLLS